MNAEGNMFNKMNFLGVGRARMDYKFAKVGVSGSSVLPHMLPMLIVL